jgi:hypothetical protein
MSPSLKTYSQADGSIDILHLRRNFRAQHAGTRQFSGFAGRGNHFS